MAPETALQTYRELVETLRTRRSASPESSYVARLYDKGLDAILKKIGEEATETIIAALTEDDAALIGEASDLVFHLSILLADRGLTWDMIAAELGRRHGTSGHAEKASRQP